MQNDETLNEKFADNHSLTNENSLRFQRHRILRWIAEGADEFELGSVEVDD